MSVIQWCRRLWRRWKIPGGFRAHRVLCAGRDDLHHMAYTDWGDPENPDVVVCVHGLSRNGRDFDHLAAALAGRYRVVCPDLPGRGQSDWLDNKADYTIATYVADMVTLIARLNVEQVHWVGTSMGGVIGMTLAALPRSPVKSLVLNDVGPYISGNTLASLRDYLGKAPRFASVDEAEAYTRKVCGNTLGALSDAHWRHLTEHAIRQTADGDWEMCYDPGIAEAFKLPFLSYFNVDLWSTYDAVRCPTLVLRGAESDVLAQDTYADMAGRGPRATLVEVPGVGHAPMLLNAAEIAVVRDFLAEQGNAAGGETIGNT